MHEILVTEHRTKSEKELLKSDKLFKMASVDWSCSQLDLQVKLKTRLLNSQAGFILAQQKENQTASLTDCSVSFL